MLRTAEPPGLIEKVNSTPLSLEVEFSFSFFIVEVSSSKKYDVFGSISSGDTHEQEQASDTRRSSYH